MKNKIPAVLFFLLLIPYSYGQKDKEAFRILDNFSSIALKAQSVSMKFRIITIDQIENKKDTLEGSVILFKDMYKLVLPDNTVWSNGETSWSYLPAEEEVTITKPDKKDNTFQDHPSKIFSMYKDGYKCRLVEEKPESYIIDLYPEDIKSDLLRVRLSISKPQMNLKKLEYKRRDGVIVTLYVLDYDLKKKAESSMFNFNPAEYNGVEIVDMR